MRTAGKTATAVIAAGIFCAVDEAFREIAPFMPIRHDWEDRALDLAQHYVVHYNWEDITLSLVEGMMIDLSR